MNNISSGSSCENLLDFVRNLLAVPLQLVHSNAPRARPLHNWTAFAVVTLALAVPCIFALAVPAVPLVVVLAALGAEILSVTLALAFSFLALPLRMPETCASVALALRLVVALADELTAAAAATAVAAAAVELDELVPCGAGNL
jgi:hypothetical protein